LKSSSEGSERKASYSLVSARSFLRDLRRLDTVAIRRILQIVELLKENPNLGKNLRGQLEGFRSLRVGDFRVIYTIEEPNRTVILRAVGHRRSVYE